MEQPRPYLSGENIGDTYLEALQLLVGRKYMSQHLTLSILQPLFNTTGQETPRGLDVDTWSSTLNLGSVYQRFCSFLFSRKTGTGESSGKAWINDRIRALVDDQGFYHKRLANQLTMVEKRLNIRNRKGERMHGSSTNALICQTFQFEDLRKACKPRPNTGGLPCLVMLDFKPKRDKLNLMAVFRSQFFDTKAYGNLISLAILLHQISQKTGYQTGSILSTANNVTFDDRKQIKQLYKHLRTS